MSNPVDAGLAEAAPKSLAARFLGIITSPRETFRSVAAHPRWLGMLALTTLIVALGASVPMMTGAGRQAAIDNQVQQMESFGFQVTDEMYAQMQRRSGMLAYQTFGTILVFSPLMALILAGILFAVFSAAMGGDATFKQLYSIVVHAGVISALSQVFAAPLNMLRGTMTSAANLGVLLPMIDEASFAGRLLRTIDLFLIWWVLVLAIGLGVLYRRRTQPIAITLLGVYAVIALCIALVMSRLGGTH
jgi:hypothetical protein